ncbi:ATP-dependent nuclease [Desulfovibrio sp.]|uniref:ATP-dependent nuclease n=1 Tax=Desulfovibrio sp. TaxID=885 RepID=UPI003D12040E
MLHQEVNAIKSRMLSNPWPKFVQSVEIQGLRGWSGQQVRFPFPVCAIAGENGSGKSTVLKAVASIYDHPSGDKAKRFFPSDFFPQTAWDNVSDVSLVFQIAEGTTTKTYKIAKPSKRWRFQTPRLKRHVVWQDISRTLPISAEVGYAKIANSVAREIASDSLTEPLKTYYSNIMGKRYTHASWAQSDVDEEKKIGVVEINGAKYSQFHQGAGEDATLDLLTLLQDVPDTSLVIIDEIEASLHPRSQRRIMHFLLWIARTKQIQVVLSTHSQYILSELPDEGRIFIERGQDGPVVSYGITPEYALNRMDDYIRPKKYIFTEDREAIVVAKAILLKKNINFEELKFIPVGASNDVSSAAHAASCKDFPIKAVGLLDADMPLKQNCFRLPGTLAPEKEIFSSLLPHIAIIADKLDKSVQTISDAVELTMTVADHHQWPSYFAERIGESANYVWETFCRIWAAHVLTEEQRDQFANDLLREIQP